MMRRELILAAAILLPAGAQAAKDPRAQLSKIFDGRTAEAPVRCVDMRQMRGLQIIDTTTVIANIGDRLYYRNDPIGGCPAQTLRTRPVTAPLSAGLCVGDIVSLVDIDRGDPVGGCTLRMWTPYRRVNT